MNYESKLELVLSSILHATAIFYFEKHAGFFLQEPAEVLGQTVTSQSANILVYAQGHCLMSH